MVLLKNADQTTMQFFQYLKSQPARQILSRYGYSSGL
jgi:accessory colonization factor AcfC